MAVGSVGKRKSERKGCSVKAQILIGGKDPIDCIVVDFSGTGARVQLAAPLDLPPRFKLFIPSRPETKRVLLRWIRGKEIGLEYSTGVANENSMFELADRVDLLEAAAGIAPEIDSRIAALEERLATLADVGPPKALLPADVPAEPGKAAFDADALERRIEKAARAAEDQARRIEQDLVSRMDQTEERLRTAFGPDAFAHDLAERMARLEALAESGAFARQAAGDGDALERQIEKVARAAEDQARRIEHNLVSRMDQTEERLRTAFAPDLAERMARLEALAESGAFERQAAGDDEASSAGPDPVLVRRIADLEAKLMAVRAPAAAGAPDLSSVHARIDQVARQAEEHAARVERFVNARVDDVEAQLISAPPPPAPRAYDATQLELQVRDLAQRVERSGAESGLEQIVERISDLEMSLMELRVDQTAPAAASVDEILLARIEQIEARNDEIVAALRNLLGLLSARDDRRAAG